jgi:hypothetical protein
LPGGVGKPLCGQCNAIKSFIDFQILRYFRNASVWVGGNEYKNGDGMMDDQAEEVARSASKIDFSMMEDAVGYRLRRAQLGVPGFQRGLSAGACGRRILPS